LKKLLFIVIFLIPATGFFFPACKQKAAAPLNPVVQSILIQVDSLSELAAEMRGAVEQNHLTREYAQKQFLKMRLAFKQFEWAAEYFLPEITRTVNGPPVQEVDMPDFRIVQPAGLQVIEGYLFPVFDTTRKKDLLFQLRGLELNGEQYKAWFRQHVPADFQIFDAAKQEIFRIITLGITGFDNPLTLKSMEESALALQALQTLMDSYRDPDNPDGLEKKFTAAIGYLRNHKDFDSFNRMEFIREYANPVTTDITLLEKRLGIHYYKYNRLLNQDAKTLFDTNTFNINAFTPDHSSFISDAKVELGKRLFSDPVLSGKGNRSCQSCHQAVRSFTDGVAKNTVIGSKTLLERNTPTLLNAALQPSLFYDLRVNTLEDQSHSVVHSTKEMQGSMAASVKKLWLDKSYREMFIRAFPFGDKSRIDTFEVMNAIGSYIRSLTFLNSRFDEYMRGVDSALDNSEISGFNLFMGKARCATCHYMPLFNGTLPPKFQRIETEVIGVPKTADAKEIDGDPGRYAVVHLESFRHAFKIPTIRNAALTAPYMHNGVYTSLEEVLDFYNRGGGAGLGFKLDNQTLPADSLHLSSRELEDIISFIRSLNSKMSADKN
jgi:cytochrome c peroxidase